LETENFNIYENGTKIIRAISDFDSEFGFINPKEFTKKAANTNNYYTLVIDNSERWKSFSKRSKSVVCWAINDLQELPQPANNLHLVVPKEGANLGVASEKDFWLSFDGFHLVSGFNTPLNDLVSYALSEDELPDVNFDSFKKKIKEVDGVLKNKNGKSYKSLIKPTSKAYSSTKSFVKEYLNSQFDNLLNFIEFKLDPKRNDFQLKSYSKNFKVSKRREVWTSSPCLLIHYQSYRYLSDF